MGQSVTYTLTSSDDYLNSYHHMMDKFKGLYAAGLVFALIGLLFAVLAIFLKDKTGRIMIIMELVFIILGMILILSGTAGFVSDVKSMMKDLSYGTLSTSDLFNTGILAANYLLTLAGGVTGIVLAALSIRYDR
jgi:ABC-type Na+ efflux pump permease subunit